ncbi:MAG: 2Fe-2S iron-sulfur cluster-binding protein [Myxococcota bacterium]
MRLKIQRGTPGQTELVTVEVSDGVSTALDALLEAQESTPDLAFRYGCRNETCGLCTVEIDGRPRLACRDRVQEGSRIAPLRTLPLIRDLVIDRSEVDATALPPGEPGVASDAYTSLDRCISCLACLDDCPIHEEGRGNPMLLLRIQQDRLSGSGDFLERADAAGLERCASCRQCRCGVGIRLVAEVIDPLLEAIE